MFERFADEARRATAQASEEARELGHDFIGTEHLLLGLLAGGEGAAVAVLSDLDVTLDDARMKVNQRVHPYGQGSIESPPFTPLAKKALERALREALQLKSESIGTEHLLLGLIDVPDGGGARILVELAGSLENVRQEILSRVSPAGPAPFPLGSTKVPLTSGSLRRWAMQGRTVFTRPGGAGVAGASAGGPGTGPAPAGAAPLCAACQAPLAAHARYHRLEVVAADGQGDLDPRGEEDPAGAAMSEALDPSAAPVPGARWEPLTVTVVYCGRCGMAVGTV